MCSTYPQWLMTNFPYVSFFICTYSGSKDALQNVHVARKRKSNEQGGEPLCKRPTLSKRQGDDNPPAQPEDQQHAQEENRVSQKRKVQEQHKKLIKEEQPSPSSIPPHFQAIEGKTVFTVNKNNCESRLQNVRSLDHKTWQTTSCSTSDSFTAVCRFSFGMFLHVCELVYYYCFSLDRTAIFTRP